MEELIQITKQTLAGQSLRTVNARELHAFLEVKDQFSYWFTATEKSHDSSSD